MDLRDKAILLFQAAVRRADPVLALRAALQDHPITPPGPGGTYILIAVGKAAIPMTEEAMRHLSPARVLVVTNAENARAVSGAEVMVSGHPVPDAAGIRAGERVVDLLAKAGAADRVVALISGGGSALLPAPLAGLTLDDKVAVSRLLLANGFEITEMNLIRQQLSRLKGGGLLRLAAPAPVTGFILSDVIGDDLRAIASGPTVAPLGNRTEAKRLLREKNVWDDLPGNVQGILSESGPSVKDLPSAENHLIGSNRASLEAVLAAFGAGAVIVNDQLTGDVADAAGAVREAARSVPPGPQCLIFGGETTVTLKGNGLGGRNQELALRVALSMPDLGRDWVFLSGGTDGRDGPTEAAGGVVDARTRGRIIASGVDPEQLLANNDSNKALDLAGDLLVSGPTGTNVADVQILLIA